MTEFAVSDGVPLEVEGRNRLSPLVFVTTVGVLALILCASLAGVLYKLHGDPQSLGSLQTCKMSDGTILTLQQVTYGNRHEFEVHVERAGIPFFTQSRKRTVTQHTSGNRIVLWFTRSDPVTGEALDFDWWSHSVAIGAQGYQVPDENPHRQAINQHAQGNHGTRGSRPWQPLSATSSISYDRIIASSQLTPLRHTGKTFALRVYSITGELAAEFDVPDPSPRVKELIAGLQRNIAKNTNDANSHNDLAWLYATGPNQFRNAKRAVELAERAMTLQPTNANYLNTLGVAYVRDEQFAKALPCLEQNSQRQQGGLECFDLYPLSMTHFQLGDKQQAKQAYDTALETYEMHKNRLNHVHRLELDEFRNEAMALFLGDDPQQVFDAANRLAREGEWQKAADEFTRGLAVYPDEHWHWFQSASLQVQIANHEEFQRQCRQMLGRFANTQDALIAERTAKICVLTPDSDVSTDAATTLVDRAISIKPEHAWILLAKGMTEYRAERFEPSLSWLEESAQQLRTSNHYCTTLIHLFSAMARHRLGQSNLAHQSMQQALQVFQEALPTEESNDFGSSWHDWVMCQIVRREAEALLQEGESSDN